MSGIVGSSLNNRGSGLIGSLGTDGQVLTSSGAGAGAVFEAGAIDDNAVTLAKMAGLARGTLIYGDTSGDPAALAVGGADEVLTHDGTDFDWAAAGGGGDNDPMFSAEHSGSSQTLSNNSWTKLTCLSSELFDYDSAYDGSRFTVPAGITSQPFLISGWVKIDSLEDNKRAELTIKINGTSETNTRAWGSGSGQHSTILATHAQQLSATDYVELFAYHNTGSSQDIISGSWSVHKLIKG